MFMSPPAVNSVPTDFTPSLLSMLMPPVVVNPLPLDVVELVFSLVPVNPSPLYVAELDVDFNVSWPSRMSTFPPLLISIPLFPAIKSLPFIVVSPPDSILSPPSPPTVLPFDLLAVVSDFALPIVINPLTVPEISDFVVSW